MAKFQSFASDLVEGLSLHDLQSRNQVSSEIKRFDKGGKDSDGKLSKQEVKDGAASEGVLLTDAEIDQAFAIIDTNKDGLLGKDEIWDYI